VIKKRVPMRNAIAMIELIFAIVVMGIVLMSAPMLISVATKSGYVALQQEAIAAASSEIGLILTRHWDEGDTDINKTAPILVTAGGDVDLNEEGTTGRRAGTPHESVRTFITSLGERIAASTNFTVEGDFDDVDDYDGHISSLHTYNSESTTTKTGDYVDANITILSTVTYLEDNSSNGTSYKSGGPKLTYNNPFARATTTIPTNIKQVHIRLTTTNTAAELDKTIEMNAFTCNIGTYELRERNF
jgi:hypothetical protein